MDINISALLLNNAIICFTLGFGLLLIAIFHKRYNGFALLSSSYFCFGFSFGLSAERFFSPEISVILAHTICSLAIFLLYIGINRFRNQGSRFIKFFISTCGAIFLSSLIFTSIFPDMRTCDIFLSLLLSIQISLCIWTTLQGTKKYTGYQIILSSAMTLVLFSFAYKTFTTIQFPETIHSFDTLWPNWSHVLIYPFTLILSSFAFIWGSVEHEEKESQTYCAKLEHNSHFMKVLLDAIPLPIFHKDMGLRYCHINRAFCEVIGLSSEQILGKTTMDIIPNKVMDLNKNYDLATLETGKEQEYETGFPFPDGLQHEIHIKKTPFIDSSGNIAGIVGAFTDITERKIYEAKIKHLALHDQVTGLPNRNMFYSQLKKSIAMAKRNNYTIALLYIDLDGFKVVNDSFGHDAGDTLLRSIGKKLIKTIRSSDTACRIGGDEFTVLAEMYNSPSDVKTIAEKLRVALSEPTNCEGNVCQTSASIGIALYPQDADSSRQLVKAADMAMYQAKQQGKNRVCFYDSRNS